MATIRGTSGNDSLGGTSENDQIFGLAGDDYIDGYDGDNIIDGGDGKDIIYSGYGKDTLYGGKGEDTIDGRDGNDTLYGGQSNDDLVGGTGNDTLDGKEGEDRLNGDEGNDTLYGGQSNDNLVGSSGNDTLLGGDGNDFLDGASEYLASSSQIDVLAGETGKDTFRVSYQYDDNAPATAGTGDYALIKNFNSKEDFIELSGAKTNYVLKPSPDGLAKGTAIYFDKPGNQSNELLGIIGNNSRLDLKASYFTTTVKDYLLWQR